MNSEWKREPKFNSVYSAETALKTGLLYLQPYMNYHALLDSDEDIDYKHISDGLLNIGYSKQ